MGDNFNLHFVMNARRASVRRQWLPTPPRLNIKHFIRGLPELPYSCLSTHAQKNRFITLVT